MLDRILIGSSAEPSDPDFENVTLLLHGDGSNGAQNNTFIDSSTNNFTITRNGNTTQGSFSPYGSNWSNYFDGSGDYLNYSSTSTLNFGTGDFTVEAWIYLNNTTGSKVIIGGSASNAFGFRYGTSFGVNGGLSIYREGVADLDYATFSFAANTWYHVAVVRQSGVIKYFVNGTQQTTSGSGGGSYSFPTETTVTVGRGGAGGEEYGGYISNVRVVKGTAVYTANFTPSTTPLTAITNTSLLTCQSNRFRDASTNNFTITRNGDVKVTNFAPFAPSSAYSTSTNGGSGYFDGSGDYLTLGSNAAYAPGSGDFTWECWVYPTATPGVFWITDTSGGLQIGFQDASTWGVARAVIQWYMTSTTLPTNFMWNHIAVTRSGSNMALFLNGTRIATKTSATADFSTGSTAIMANLSGVSATAGYTTDIRLVKGTAIYDPTVSTYTVPTAPLTAVTNTGFLAKCQNAAIFDNSMKNDLETVGNAQISTSVKKFGTGSMAFDGSGDYLHFEYPVAYFAPTSWTMETFVYFNNLSSDTGLFGYSDMFFIRITSSAIRIEYRHTPSSPAWAVNNTSYTLSTGTWYHFAIVVNNGSMRVYIDGTAIGTATTGIGSGAKGGAGPNKLIVGATDQYTFDSVDSFLNGYMDEVRITSGVARYTSNFTPPTAAFPNK